MRSTIQTLIFTCIFAAGALAPAALAAPKVDVGAGRAAWFDITTTSMPLAKDFYGKLFDWQFTPLKGTNRAVEIVSSGKPIGTIRVADGAISGFNGMVYVQVDDMPAACDKAKALGGTIPEGFPFNLGDSGGAVAVVIDPAGHPIGMYSRTPLPPAPPK
jgi:predicted enzyme related to lactoylglutathione lyase